MKNERRQVEEILYVGISNPSFPPKLNEANFFKLHFSTSSPWTLRGGSPTIRRGGPATTPPIPPIRTVHRAAMASFMDIAKSFSSDSAEEKKNNDAAADDANSSTSGIETPRSEASAEMNGGAGGPSGAEKTSMVSDAAVLASEGGAPVNISPSSAPNAIVESCSSHACPRWSAVLSTPQTSPLLTPASEMAHLKQNLHGLGLKHAADRTKLLARTGRNCSHLLGEIASLHDELGAALGRACPALLEQAGQGTPMEQFSRDVNACLSSFVEQTKVLGGCLRDDVARPYHESSAKLAEEGAGQYANYTASRTRCAQSRKEALKLRKKYVDGVKELDQSMASLRKARAAKARKRKATDSSNGSSDSGKEEGIELSRGGGMVDAAPAWEEELRQYGEKSGLGKQCETVIKASEEVHSAETNYSLGVAGENVAVDDACDAERAALDSLQKLEEERIVFVIGLMDRLLQKERESLENMSLDLGSVAPLDMSESNHVEVSMPATPSSTPALFMNPRRRAQSDDGPAINETRMLNLPDNIAEVREQMKTLMGRQLGRLKTLKMVTAFNDAVASAVDAFASGLKAQLEGLPASKAMNKNEGGNVLGAWNAAIGSLEMCATHAEVLARRIKEGTRELQLRFLAAEKDAKAFREREEFRWKTLCDAARVETKAKLKHKQCSADLEKARARLTLMDGAQGDEGAAGDGDGANFSPMKSTKMDAHMNKAMGKMFSILPGGGEDAMKKVLTPQQRQAIAQRQLDEAKLKEERSTESFEVARSVKQQALVSYETESEAVTFRFKADERKVWDEMQKSLLDCVEAIKIYRERHMKSVESSIELAKSSVQGNALDDMANWTALAEKRVQDQRSRIIDDPKLQDEEGQPDGFCLKVQLVERVDVKELVRRFLDDEDILEDCEMLEDDEVADASPGEGVALPDVPPDPIIPKMETIFSKKLKGVSIERYYTAGWSEEVPLYEPWLKRKGSFDVTVSDWEDGEGFQNEWSGEKFTAKRVIKFKFKRVRTA
ncbi:hypothetical protein ACHAXT_011797 [Thalassiosira profunda]